MTQHDQLSARELYDLAFKFHKSDDKSQLIETCEILLRKFPDSNEAKWASNRFKLTNQDDSILHDPLPEMPTQSPDNCDKCGEKIPPIAAKCHCGGHRIPAPPKPPRLPKALPKNKKLAPCRVCEKEIATEAAICPHCGIAKPGSSEFGAAVSDGWKGIETIARIAAAILLVLIIAKCNAGS